MFADEHSLIGFRPDIWDLIAFASMIGAIVLEKRISWVPPQIDVKISFKGRHPNKESAAKSLCRYVSPATVPAYEKERHYVTHPVDEMVSI